MRNGNTASQFKEYNGMKRVLTVPMRNGNLVLRKFLCQFLCVLTVPMRNGNRDWVSEEDIDAFRFLPYL